VEQKTLSRWLKTIIIGMGLCGLVVYGLILPFGGRDLAAAHPELAHFYWPWLCFLLATGLPCFAVLALGWRIAGSIGEGRSFSMENAKRLAHISRLAAGDAGFLFVGNVVLLLMNMHHPSVFIALLAVVFAGVAIAVAAACLSHLVQKAAALQEQSDLTI